MYYNVGKAHLDMQGLYCTKKNLRRRQKRRTNVWIVEVALLYKRYNRSTFRTSNVCDISS